ncbi:GTP 3',8-cyclase MoaA [Teredinibacter purpureus]|uniref:GTP 3',8-cyclase MoaA n=1 Tax=Teredinibacter purpureus TaxID=2731756 RepID=UPI0005F7E841|nr:GTP 3',8-cyclase MoaA [Teredinibacter purpureus]
MSIYHQLTDSYQRQFTYLRLSVTDQCNFRCNYCLPDGYSAASPDPFLSLEEIQRVAAAFALNGTKKIRITGGEPTLRKDLADIIRICKSTPGIETVALTSNGYKITQQLPALVDAGLDQLNLSADSLEPANFEMITGHNKLQEVLAGIDLAISLGLKRVKLNVVLMREFNRNELSKFLEFVSNRPISLRFIELMQTGDNVEFFKKQHVSGAEIQQHLEQNNWLQVLRDPHAGPAVEYTHPHYEGNIGLIMPYSKDFCSSCNRLRVSSHGNLHLCLFADAHESLRPYLTQESSAQLAKRLQHLLGGKKETHDLHEGNSGSTRHLAMLGG